MSLEVVLFAAALLFAFVNGLNDGGAVLSIGLRVRSIRPLTGVVALALTVAVAPLVFGTAVATTLVARMVAFEGATGQLALLVAVLVAVAVSWVLADRGLPTSLTLALIGAITGAGLGGGLSVDWRAVIVVVLLATLAPVAGVGVGWTLARLAGWLPPTVPAGRRVSRWHVVSFALQCLAYATNDGQKMLAVLAVAVTPVVAGVPAVPAVPWQLALIGVLFLAGSVVGLPRIATTLAGGVVPVSPPDAVATELSAASVVLATAAAGSPVSMTQAIAGAQVGTAVTRGRRRIRWREVLGIASAWVVTLPAAFALAAIVVRVVLPLTS